MSANVYGPSGITRTGRMQMEARAADRALTFRMPAEARLAGLSLRVRDLDLVEGFYRGLLGLRVTERRDGGITLAPAGARFFLELVPDPGASLRPRPSLGLYHFALLLPDRAALAAAVRRLLEQRWGIEGASDHGVSEAFYLHDPEGNGIELYRDRPRETWPVAEDQVAMTSSPIDVDELIAASPAGAALHPETRLGHIHLHVGDLAEGERFYAGTLGLTVTQRTYPGALFLAAGGYHHHVGLNTWARGRRAPDGATGMTRYAWVVAAGIRGSLETHLRDVKASFHESDGTLALVDPIGIGVEIRAGSR